jgi:hypothetical protein
MLKTISLPRQSRDNHRKQGVFPQAWEPSTGYEEGRLWRKGWTCEKPLFGFVNFLMINAIGYQDRLGTNIGNVEERRKMSVVCAGGRW